MIWNEGYLDILSDSSPVHEQLNKKGDEVARNFRAMAPVLTGTYRDSVSVEEAVSGDNPHVTVISDTEYSMVNEGRFGTLNKALRASSV
jgi:hypothetical protein